MTIHEAVKFSIQQLRSVYNEREAENISDLLIENITGSPKANRISNKEKLLTVDQSDKLNAHLRRLEDNEPIQYVLNEAWFYGMKFYVDQNVLIPRPETEELVDWVISDCKFPIAELKILDIGSGSGCIPIALKRKLRKADVTSCDISEAAISVAEKNANSLGATINFLNLDFLNRENWNRFSLFNVFASNPPYIPEKDKEQMQPNVLKYEPSTALFVPDNDPLVFYKAIAEFGKTHLNKTGKIYVEIHEDLGDPVLKIFRENNYSADLRKDMQGKERMIKASLRL